VPQATLAPYLKCSLQGGDLDGRRLRSGVGVGDDACRHARVLSVFLSRCGRFVVLAPERTPTREAS
jgi:hypothetical protein